MFTVSGVRYYASGFTSGGSYEALEALTRGGVAAGALAVYPELFGSLSVATNYLTYGITHAPAVEPGLTKLLVAATVGGFTPLGIGTIAAVVAVVLLVLLLVTKIVLATLLALLYVVGVAGDRAVAAAGDLVAGAHVAAVAARRAAVAGRSGRCASRCSRR